MIFLIIFIGVWIGVSSLVYSLCLLFLSAIPKGFPILDIALFGFCIFLSQHFQKKWKTLPNQDTSHILMISFYLLLVLNILSFAFQSLREPHGGWDGWAVWNLHARFLFRASNHWEDLFSSWLTWFHPDYPWLLPATVSRFWHYLGRETTKIPILVALFFNFGTLGLLFFGLKKMPSKNQALMGAIVLLGTPLFITHGCSQSGDIPLGFFILATFILFYLHDRLDIYSPGLLTLAGFVAGLATWTKNDGFLFVFAILSARIFARIWQGKKERLFKEILSFGLGFMPVLLIVGYFTLLAPSSNFLAGQNMPTTLYKLTNPDRYLMILGVFYKQLTQRDWNWFPLFLIFYALIVGIQIEKGQRLYLATSFVALLIVVLGDFFVFVVTPWDLAWHLGNTFHRLLYQLWPSLLFNYFLVVPVPKKLFTKAIPF